MDFLLSPSYDWVIEQGDTVIVKDASFVRQLWAIRVQTFRGEWLLDDEDGVPYLQTVYQKSNPKYVEDVFRELTEQTLGVLLVTSVAVSEFDRAARTIRVEVEAVIEGPEDTTFIYDGSLPGAVEDDPNFPSTIAGLSMWFDAQDLLSLEYTPNSSLVLQNKGGEGYGTAVAASGFPTLVGVSPLNNKRSILLDNDDSASNNQVLNIFDTPAIRNTDEITILHIAKPKAMTSPAYPIDYGLLYLDGINGITREGYNLIYNESAIASALNILTVNSSDGMNSVAVPYPFQIPELYVMRSKFSTVDHELQRTGVDQIISVLPGTSEQQLNGDGVIGALKLEGGAPILSDYFNGYFGELLVYNRKLTDTELSELTTFLINKWDLVPLAIPDIYQDGATGDIYQDGATGDIYQDF